MHTGKASSDKHSCKASESTNEWSTWNTPIATANITMFLVHTNVDQYSDNDEHNDSGNLQR